MAAEIEYSIYENQSSGVKELFGINRHTGGIFLLKSAVPWGEYPPWFIYVYIYDMKIIE